MTKAAEISRLNLVPSTSTVPPGVKICPGANQYCVAAFGTIVLEPSVMAGGAEGWDF
jgi:pyruvoyl-dependent arginine decarboxylase (PvlArgDC)